MDPLETRLNPGRPAFMSVRDCVRSVPWGPRRIISWSGFLPIPEATGFARFLNNPEYFHSPTTSYIEKRPSSPLRICAKLQFFVRTSVPLADVG